MLSLLCLHTLWSSEIVSDKLNVVCVSAIEVTNSNDSHSCTSVIHCCRYLVA